MSPLDFDQAARLPFATDNAAIATRMLGPGQRLRLADGELCLSHGVLEGHRFAVAPVAVGEPLMSWGLPFGLATRDIAPGDYLINDLMVDALGSRKLAFPLPDVGNFRNHSRPFDPAAQVADTTPTPAFEGPGFMGFPRADGRGVGTRNHLAVIGLSAAAGPLAEAIAARFADAADPDAGFDGVVPVAHTEGGTPNPQNRDYAMRALAGFTVHANVGATLLIDAGDATYNALTIKAFMRDNGYPFDALPVHVIDTTGGLDATMQAASDWITATLPTVRQATRSMQPLSALRVALQCGGSDAFSGVSGNPLAGWIARAVVGAGGYANLAETDELIGAESYALARVKDPSVITTFLATMARFRELAGRHGHSPEGNPSGGNFYRGLYNITIKSLGAAMKKAPDVRLDGVLDYGVPMPEPGYYFMDSPGNDLESVAGQVATGCNLVYFVTGNGSITNFPFVPTIKIVTTTGRYQMLRNEMDVNAGAYLDGMSMDDLGHQTLDLSRRVAGGERTAGERAAHSQVQIWRNWAQGPGEHAATNEPTYTGVPIIAAGSTGALPETRPGRLGLILPTSLCSGQIARQIATRLTAAAAGSASISQWGALPHTEGCGVSGGRSEALYVRTLVSYAQHPLVGAAHFLEHGCEKTHNGYIRQALEARGIDPDHYGWTSIQLDGGIAAASQLVADWAGTATSLTPPAGVTVGLHCDRPPADAMADALVTWLLAHVRAGGSVVLADRDPLILSAAWRREIGETASPTVAYGDVIRAPGLHIMAAPTRQLSECLAGLGATGAQALALVGADPTAPGHPVVPTVTIDDPITIASTVAAALIGDVEPAALTHFQITRGTTGFSL